jgi:hypothetical protein
MSLSAYEVTIPTMLRGLGVLDHYLDEASKLTMSWALDWLRTCLTSPNR